MSGRAAEVEQAWAAYGASGSIAHRNRLVELHLNLVGPIVGAVLRQWSGIEAGDAQSLGAIGLIQAVERFDPARGWTFKTFASYRIRGAILDGLRAVHGRQSMPITLSLDADSAVHGKSVVDPRVDVESSGLAPVVSIEVARAIARLPARHRLVVWRWFFVGDSLAEIGRDLGVTESRACQLKAEALGRLRHRRMGLVA